MDGRNEIKGGVEQMGWMGQKGGVGRMGRMGQKGGMRQKGGMGGMTLVRL